ncbi:hypothetical protein [Aeromicrobium stalagmiti]|uniref:hypothetical protein n=1 Tax=Aeromicrobium stalagmiti TaxID=2738988 RepID=UPI001568FD16|nr:hypothetical protein [Aeromicrobium stalagmiti]NRQ50517.1 hypothetical protein [Aeromicrobium stalagmiti]
MRRLAIMSVTVLLLAGCTSGSDDDASGGGSAGGGSSSKAPSATDSTPTPTGPDCSDVWKAGETLPADYDQCVADGEFGAQDVIPCEDGSKLVTFEDTLYAVTGQEIVEPDVAPLQDTEEYGTVYSSCTGEE